MLPTFLVIGAAKCGTTTLYEYLRQHPEVFMTKTKEPTYFAGGNDTGVSTLAEYAALFEEAAQSKARGEASGAYLFDRQAPHRIRAELGDDIQLIALLRNPVDMAYSLWGHMVRVGEETLSFDQALDAEAERQASEQFNATSRAWAPNFFYTQRARYAEQLARYLEVFDQQQLRVFLYEEFFSQERDSMRQIYEFIGVSPEHEVRLGQHNPAGSVRSPALREALQGENPLKSLIKRTVPGGLRRSLKGALQKANTVVRPLPPLTPAQRSRVRDTVADDIVELAALLDRSLEETWK